MGMGMQQPMGMGMQQPMGMGMQQPGMQMGMGMQQPMGMQMGQPMGMQMGQPCPMGYGSGYGNTYMVIFFSIFSFFQPPKTKFTGAWRGIPGCHKCEELVINFPKR